MHLEVNFWQGTLRILMDCICKVHFHCIPKVTSLDQDSGGEGAAWGAWNSRGLWMKHGQYSDI